MHDREEFDNCANQMRALADPLRLRLVTRLFKGRCNVSQLCEMVDENIANVSRNLQILRHARIVVVEREGRNLIYSLHPDIVVSRNPPGMHRIQFERCTIDIRRG